MDRPLLDLTDERLDDLASTARDLLTQHAFNRAAGDMLVRLQRENAMRLCERDGVPYREHYVIADLDGVHDHRNTGGPSRIPSGSGGYRYLLQTGIGLVDAATQIANAFGLRLIGPWVPITVGGELGWRAPVEAVDTTKFGWGVDLKNEVA